jgi:predicted Rossmann-fold nucleotide-binding protein
MHFMMRAKAMVAFPGGFGTLDELFEVITLVQTGKSKPVPIILFGKDYWKRLINLDVLVEEGAFRRKTWICSVTDDPARSVGHHPAFYKL